MTKPDIPKRLASKIRAAQHELKEVLHYIAAADFNHRQNAPRLAEYDADPVAFARKHYPRHSVDSYPVQTNISRIREKEEYYASRQDIRKQRVKDRLRELQDVEDAVLAEVTAMRPSAGRVPWPDPLPSVDEMMAEHRAEEDRILEQSRHDNIIRQQAIDEDDRLEQEEIREQQEINDAETRKMLTEMTPEQRQRWREMTQLVAEDIRSGRAGLHNMQEYFDAKGWLKPKD